MLSDFLGVDFTELKHFRGTPEVFFLSTVHEPLLVCLKHPRGFRRLPLSSVEGLPEPILNEPLKLAAFLAQAELRRIPARNEPSLRFSLHLGLKGGGNIGTGIQKWPVVMMADKPKMVIPYRIAVSATQALAVHEGELSLQQAEMSLNTLEYQRISAEVTVLEAVKRAVELWNASGLVLLLNPSEYQKQFGAAPVHSVRFATNHAGVCYAPAIGMSPELGETELTCDLAGHFKKDSVQSMLHEIGHVIGLRHEHVRHDRAQYIDTNFNESNDCLAVGEYDFESVMHYGLGRYAGTKRIELAEAFKTQVRNQEGIKASEVLATLQAQVGKMPRLSPGDLQAVTVLYQAELQAARASYLAKIDSPLASLQPSDTSAQKRQQLNLLKQVLSEWLQNPEQSAVPLARLKAHLEGFRIQALGLQGGFSMR